MPQSYLVLAYGENLYAENEKQNYQDILANGLFKSFHAKSIFTTSYKNMANPLDLLYELSEGRLRQSYKENWNELLEIAGIIKNKLNTFLQASPAQNIIILENGAYFKFFDTDKNQFLDFDQISEGYRSYIILLTDIIMRILAARKRLLINGYKTEEIFDKVKGAIIIDEFDKHMHPSWQRTFLKTLRKEFPKIQFFLSTHNIVSLQSAEGEKIFIISEKKGKVQIEEELLAFGNTIEETYRIFFDDKIYSEKANEIIEEFNKLKRFAIVKKEKKYLAEYISKSEKIKSEFKEEQSENFTNALNIDIAYLTDFFKKQENDKNQ